MPLKPYRVQDLGEGESCWGIARSNPRWGCGGWGEEEKMTGTLKELGRNPERTGRIRLLGYPEPCWIPKGNWRDFTAAAVPNNGAPWNPRNPTLIFQGLGGHHATANEEIIGRVHMLIVCLVDNTRLFRVESNSRTATNGREEQTGCTS